MPYDEQLAARIRTVVAGEPGLTEKRMFGGLSFLINGNMAISASGQGDLLLRVDPKRTDALVRELSMAMGKSSLMARCRSPLVAR